MIANSDDIFVKFLSFEFVFLGELKLGTYKQNFTSIFFFMECYSTQIILAPYLGSTI